MMDRDTATILHDNPSEPGWYIACLTIPEDAWLQPVYWDGFKWYVDYPMVNHVYDGRFETEAEAEIYGGKDLY